MEEIRKLFKIELPSYYNDYYDDFKKQYNRRENIMSNDEIRAIKDMTDIEDYFINALYNLRDIINDNNDYHLAISYFVYVTIIKRHPWQNYVHEIDLIDIEGYDPHTIDYFLVSKQLAYTILYKQPPIDKNQRNIKSYLGYSRSFYKEHNFVGINEFSWNLQCAGGCMFDFGMLTFCPSYFTNDFPIITNGKEYVTLVVSGIGISKDGDLTSNKEEIVARTYFEETNSEFIGTPIAKDGTVSSEIVHFSKNEYRYFLHNDGHTCDIHIPTNCNYTVEEIKKSFEEARKFYNDFYPGFNIKAFAGYSWIFAKELKHVLKEDSKILAVNSFFHIIPTCGTYDESLSFIREGSNLYNRMKETREKGIKFHYAIMYIPLSEIED